VQVRVDDREPLDSVLPYLRSVEGITVEVRRLPVGDYEVDDRLIFERANQMGIHYEMDEKRQGLPQR
jgi:ERCC4-type nuclease